MYQSKTIVWIIVRDRYIVLNVRDAYDGFCAIKYLLQSIHRIGNEICVTLHIMLPKCRFLYCVSITTYRFITRRNELILFTSFIFITTY
jgi:hypothetical protein